MKTYIITERCELVSDHVHRLLEPLVARRLLLQLCLGRDQQLLTGGGGGWHALWLHGGPLWALGVAQLAPRLPVDRLQLVPAPRQRARLRLEDAEGPVLPRAEPSTRRATVSAAGGALLQSFLLAT